MEPKNGGLEDDFPFQTGDFQVPAVNFPGCTPRLAGNLSDNMPLGFLPTSSHQVKKICTKMPGLCHHEIRVLQKQ